MRITKEDLRLTVLLLWVLSWVILTIANIAFAFFGNILNAIVLPIAFICLKDSIQKLRKELKQNG